MSKRIVGLLLAFFICVTLYPDEAFFSEIDMDISLKASMENRKVNVYIFVKNKKSENCYIPYDYLNFYCKHGESVTMHNNWLMIFDDKKNEVPYFGLMGDRVIKREKKDCYFLAKNQEYIISLKNIQSSYLFPETTEYITVKYLGPLGESNTVKVQIE